MACVVSGKAEVAKYAKLHVGKPLALKDQSQESFWLLAKDKKTAGAALKTVARALLQLRWPDRP